MIGLAAANTEIRAALTAAETRQQANARELALWRLEAALEQLHLADHLQIPETFDLKAWLAPCQLTDHERRCIGFRRTIKALIAYIFDELLEQPLPGWDARMVAPFVYNSEDWLPMRDTFTRRVRTMRGVHCAEPGCDRFADKRGYCTRHYSSRWRRGTLGR